MTREKAIRVADLLFKIEKYEAVLEELHSLTGLKELVELYGENVEAELAAVVQAKLDILLKELEEM